MSWNTPVLGHQSVLVGHSFFYVGYESDRFFFPSIFYSFSGGGSVCSDTVGNPGSSLSLCVQEGKTPCCIDAHERRCWEEEPDTQISDSVSGILYTLHCLTLPIKDTILLPPPGCIPSSKRAYRHSINLTEICCAAVNVGFCGTTDFQITQSELAPREQAEQQTHVRSRGALVPADLACVLSGLISPSGKQYSRSHSASAFWASLFRASSDSSTQ